MAYTIENSLSSTFSKTMTELPKMEDILEADTVTRITVGSALAEFPAGEVLLTVEVTAASGASAVLAFYEYGVDSYAVTMDTRAMLVSADRVDKLIRTLKSMQ